MTATTRGTESSTSVSTARPSASAGTAEAVSPAMATLCERIEASEREHRRRAAADFDSYFQLLLLIAREDKPTVQPGQITLAYLSQTKNGSLLRQAGAALAQLKGISERRAKKLLRITVNLHQHGAELLAQLADGRLSVLAVEQAAAQLDSIAPPNPAKDSHGQQWQPEHYAEELQRVEDAKTTLGQKMAEAAHPQLDEDEFTAKAKQLREEHHPKSRSLRHADAHQRRHVRIRRSVDGMSFIEAFVSSQHAQTLHNGLQQLTKAIIADGKAANRTRTQLEADIFMERLLGTVPSANPPTQVIPAATAANTQEQASRSTSQAKKQPQQHALPGLALASTSSPSSTTTSPVPTVIILTSLADAIGLGACLGPEQLPYLEKKYPELYRQAQRNREHFSTHAKDRQTNHPPGTTDSGITTKDLLTGQELDAETSAEYLHRAELLRAVITDPISGYPVGLGGSYRPNQQLRELIMLRDQYCRFPGCPEPAGQCELNHTDPWANGGNTSYANLELACRPHHTGLSAGWWSVTADSPGSTDSTGQSQGLDQGRGKQVSDDGHRTYTHRATGKKLSSRPALPLDPDAWEDYRRRQQAADEPPF